jgi:hypothetical protein
MLVMAQGCMSILPSPLQMTSTTQQLRRKSGLRAESLFVAQPKQDADSLKTSRYSEFQVRVITQSDSVWPNNKYWPENLSADYVPRTEMRRYLRKTFRSADAQNELGAWVSEANDSALVLTIYSTSGLMVKRSFPLDSIRYIAISRSTRRWMNLAPTTSDVTGSVMFGLGATTTVLSPYLAFGQWSGLQTGYFWRLSLFLYGGCAVAGVGGAYRGTFYGLNDRLYLFVTPKSEE